MIGKHGRIAILVASVAGLVVLWLVFRDPGHGGAAHAARVTKAQHAFCNCLKTGASLQECLGSAETGDGRAVNDQELLLSRCLDSFQPRPQAEGL